MEGTEGQGESGDLRAGLDARRRTLARALEIAREAAQLLRQGREQGSATANEKHPFDLVTEFDRRAEALIAHRLQEAFPAHGVVGEEGVSISGGDPETPVWYVDPLDGTTNFFHRLPWFAISLGLVTGNQRQVGIVLAPELRWEFTAVRGGGAQLNGAEIHVSSNASLREALLASGLSFRFEAHGLDNARAVLATSHGIRRMGSAALDCAMVACGWVDGYWERGLKPWDLAAGALLVTEAGGQVSGTDATPFDLQHGHIIATNGLIHGELLSLMSVVELREPERRKYPRFQCAVSLSLSWNDQTAQVTATNISRGGALLEGDAELLARLCEGSNVRLHDHGWSQDGTVVRCTPGARNEYKIAVRFFGEKPTPLSRLPSVH